MFSHSNLVESQRNKIDSLELEKKYRENDIKNLEYKVEAKDRKMKEMEHAHQLEIEEIKHLTKMSKEKQRCEFDQQLIEKEREHHEQMDGLRAEMRKTICEEIEKSRDYMASILETLMENMHGNSGKK